VVVALCIGLWSLRGVILFKGCLHSGVGCQFLVRILFCDLAKKKDTILQWHFSVGFSDYGVYLLEIQLLKVPGRSLDWHMHACHLFQFGGSRYSSVQINNSAYIVYQLLPVICSFEDVLGVFLIAVNTSDDILDSALLYYSQEERRIGELVSLQQDVDYQLFASVHMKVYVHYWSTAIIFKWQDQGETYWTICAAKISMPWDPEISEFFLVAKVLQCIHCVLTVFQTLGGITCPVPMSVTTQGTMRLPHSSNSQVNGLIFSASVLQWSQLPCIVLYYVQLSVLGQHNAYNFGEGMDGRELSLHQVLTKILISATIRPDSWDSASIYDSHAVVLQSRSFVMQWVLVI
jgi:hypothetical protein